MSETNGKPVLPQPAQQQQRGTLSMSDAKVVEELARQVEYFRQQSILHAAQEGAALDQLAAARARITELEDKYEPKPKEPGPAKREPLNGRRHQHA